MSSFTASIQYSIGSPNHRDLTRQANKWHLNCKGGNKTVTVCRWHDSIHWKPYRLHKKNYSLICQISEFVKIVGYKVNIQKSKAFLYKNNEILETETRGWNLIYYSNKKNKVLRNKLNQGGKRPVVRKLQKTEERK